MSGKSKVANLIIHPNTVDDAYHLTDSTGSAYEESSEGEKSEKQKRKLNMTLRSSSTLATDSTSCSAYEDESSEGENSEKQGSMTMTLRSSSKHAISRKRKYEETISYLRSDIDSFDDIKEDVEREQSPIRKKRKEKEQKNAKKRKKKSNILDLTNEEPPQKIKGRTKKKNI